MKTEQDGVIKYVAPLVAIIGIALSSIFLQFDRHPVNFIKQEHIMQQASAQEHPSISITAEKDYYGYGGLITQTIFDDPVVSIRTSQLEGNIKIETYKVSRDFLLDAFVHDAEFNLVNQEINTERLEKTSEFEKSFTKDVADFVALPVKEQGIWLVMASQGDVRQAVFIVRSKTGVLVRESDEGQVFWAQSVESGKRVPSGKISYYSLNDKKAFLAAAEINSQGLATLPENEEADIALFESGTDLAIIPLKMRFIGRSGYFSGYYNKMDQRYYFFTDRPLYKPGDTIYFKAIIRQDNDVRYTLPAGKYVVRCSRSLGREAENIFEKIIDVSPYGSIDGEFQLPASLKTGNYIMTIMSEFEMRKESALAEGAYYPERGYAYFNVEYYEKPEYTLELEPEKDVVIQGSPAKIKINGEYFFGQPLADAEVEYSVYSSYYYEPELLRYSEENGNEFKYYSGFYSSSGAVDSGVAKLDKKGEAEISLVPKIFSENNNKRSSQVQIIEAKYKDASGVQVLAKKNILVRSGQFGIFRSDEKYGFSVGQNADIELALKSFDEIELQGIKLNIAFNRTLWNYDPVTNRSVRETEQLSDMSVVTDQQGKAVLNFVPAKEGSYVLTVNGEDKLGNKVEKDFHIWVSSDGAGYRDGTSQKQGNLDLFLNKDVYQVGETVVANIKSQESARDVFVSVERERMDRYWVVALENGEASLPVRLSEDDLPNTFLVVSGFDQKSLEQDQRQIALDTSQKEMEIELTPDRLQYGPGDTVALDIQTRDKQGKAVSAEVALWVVDKALYELTEKDEKDIFSTFWHERYHQTVSSHSLNDINVDFAEMGGCFATGTMVLMKDKTEKPIEEIKTGDVILTRTGDAGAELTEAAVAGTHHLVESGVLLINHSLRVTPNHLMRINGRWQVAGNIQAGDYMTDAAGNKVAVDSVEWQAGKFDVYNLVIEKEHTYIVDNVWVHNDKGGGTGRSEFKDTAYWNPVFHTNGAGRGKVFFQLPENLTTWAIAALGHSVDTVVGEGFAEVTSSKDVVLRPIMPEIIREGDEIVLSAMLHNFTEKEQVFDVDLAMQGAKVEQPYFENVKVPAGEFVQLYWKVFPYEPMPAAEAVFSAVNKQDAKASDKVTMRVDLLVFGFTETSAFFISEPGEYDLGLASEANIEKSSLDLEVASSLTGSLPSAMKYLVGYPYGCIEQTTSKFVPAIIAKKYSNLYQEALKDKKIDEMLQTGVERLKALQEENGSWSWWVGEHSSAFITAYVTDFLVTAKKSGIEIDEWMLTRVQKYFSNELPSENNLEDKVALQYGKGLLGISEGKAAITEFENLEVDLLALAALANHYNGYAQEAQAALQQLVNRAVQQEGIVYWKVNSQQGQARFLSEDGASALAIHALLTMGYEDRNFIEKAVRYLSKNRGDSYWSNTYATAQVIRAISEVSGNSTEAVPNYQYALRLGDKEVFRSNMKSYQQLDKIHIDGKDLTQLGQLLTVEKQGAGELYISGMSNSFLVKKEIEPLEKQLKISRQYINVKGSNYNIATGDVVEVILTVENPELPRMYAVIEDPIASGLVPINYQLKNEQSSEDYFNRDSSLEIQKDKVVIPVYNLRKGKNIYKYRARVVNEGQFAVPPANALLMYFPEIQARTGMATVNAEKESKYSPLPEKNNSSFYPDKKNSRPLKKSAELSVMQNYFDNYNKLVIIVAVFLLAAGFVAKKKYFNKDGQSAAAASGTIGGKDADDDNSAEAAAKPEDKL